MFLNLELYKEKQPNLIQTTLDNADSEVREFTGGHAWLFFRDTESYAFKDITLTANTHHLNIGFKYLNKGKLEDRSRIIGTVTYNLNFPLYAVHDVDTREIVAEKQVIINSVEEWEKWLITVINSNFVRSILDRANTCRLTSVEGDNKVAP